VTFRIYTNNTDIKKAAEHNLAITLSSLKQGLIQSLSGQFAVQAARQKSFTGIDRRKMAAEHGGAPLCSAARNKDLSKRLSTKQESPFPVYNRQLAGLPKSAIYSK